MPNTKKIELLRALDDNTWDTLVVGIPLKPRGGSRKFIEKHVIPDLSLMAMNRSCVLLTIYNEHLNADTDNPREPVCTFGPNGTLVTD